MPSGCPLTQSNAKDFAGLAASRSGALKVSSAWDPALYRIGHSFVCDAPVRADGQLLA